MSMKALQAIKDGTFPLKVTNRLLRMSCGKNDGLENHVLKCAEYRQLEKAYADVLARNPAKNLRQMYSNKTWTCWQQGLNKAPPLIRACIESQQLNMPGRELIVIDDNNLGNYLELPYAIVKKREEGIISAAHYSDIVRCALLCQHVGMWCDATVLCTAPDFPSHAAGFPMCVFKEFDLGRTDSAPILASSWFIAARSHHPILEKTLELLYTYWERENHLCHYFLFHLFFAMSARRFPEEWARVPSFNNHGPHTLMFQLGAPFCPERWKWILRTSDIHKLTRHRSFNGQNGSFYQHVLDEFLPTGQSGEVLP